MLILSMSSIIFKYYLHAKVLNFKSPKTDFLTFLERIAYNKDIMNICKIDSTFTFKFKLDAKIPL